MKLVIVYSPLNMVVRLINVDTINSESSSDRDLATWMATKGTNLRWTCWNNKMRSELNPYQYNRVNIHYTREDGKTVTTSYYCIHDVIRMDEMTFNNFDSTKLEF